MKRRLLILLPVVLLTTLSCSTTQVEKAKKIAVVASKITIASLPLMARVATAYGAPYADIVLAFAEAAHPEKYADKDDDDYYDDEDAYEDDEQYDDDDSYGDDEDLSLIHI